MKKSVIVLFLFFSSFSLVGQLGIDGPTEVCAGSSLTYEVQDGDGGPYVWRVEGGSIDNIYQGNAVVNIDWEDQGTLGSVIVFDRSSQDVFKLDVNIITYPNPDIFFPGFPLCFKSDSLDIGGQGEVVPLNCIPACAGQAATYSAINITSGSNVSWNVEGAISVDDSASDQITVTWPTTGFGSVEIIEENDACSETVKYCVEVIEVPDVSILSSATSVCSNQTVYLEAVSDNAVEYNWSYKDNIFSKLKDTEISFDQGGVHTIDLITKTSCLCSDTTQFVITVLPELGPEIDCITPTHINEEQTYYATDDCDVYNWNIGPEGIIIDGGGVDDDFVTVEWSDGPEGEISLSLSGCDADICQGVTTMYVPVITPNFAIEGPDNACKDEQSVFTAPLYPGTIYNWTILGNGFIFDGYQTNQITVQWNDSPGSANQATVSLNYENCLLDCVGSATKTVDLSDRFIVGAEVTQACEGGTFYVAAQSGWDYPNADLNLYDPSGNLIQSFANSNFQTFTVDQGPGTYTIEAIINNGYCNTVDQGLIEVFAKPEALTDIDGPQIICRNESYTYTHIGAIESTYNLNWTFFDGGVNTNLTGTSVRYTWTSPGPYSVSVVVEDQLNRCESESLLLLVNPATGGIVEGDDVVCLHETAAYNIKDSQVKSDWTIIPDNAGSIYYVDETTIEVTWTMPGTHTLSSNSCGVVSTYSVEVLAPPSFNLDYEPAICADQFTTVTVSGGTFSNVEIIDDNFNVYSNLDDIPAGFYKVTVEDDNGCTAEEQIRIDKWPVPDIFISTPDEEGFCLPGDPPRTIYPLNTEDGYTYQWYKDGAPYGGNDQILITKTYGRYYVVVTDVNGCVGTSNTLFLYEDCREPGECADGRCPGPCTSLDAMLMTSNNLGYCNEYQFNNVSTSGHDPASVYWHFDDRFAGPDSVSFLQNPTHTFTNAGFYEVILFGLVPDADNPGQWCLDYDWEVIEVPVAADFYAHEACRGDAMLFENTSTFIQTRNISSYAWNFGDVFSSTNTSTDESPTHVFSAPGIYKVELVITAESGCMSRMVQDVEVFDGPDLDFDLPINRCFGEGLKFKINDPTLSGEEWTFENPTGGPSVVSSNVAIHEYDVVGIYDVTLSAENIYGCLSTVTKPVEVGAPSISGDITSDRPSPICEGESVTLSAPAGALEYYWSNGETTQDIVAMEGGEYYVTVVSGTACDHVTDAFLLDVETRPDIFIYGTIGDGFLESDTYYDVMDVCLNDRYYVRSRWLNGVTISWNLFSETTTSISPSSVRALGVGEHKIIMTATSPTGCSYESPPLILRIHDDPPRPTIVADRADLCEGRLTTLSVDNPDPNLKYYWNTGEAGTEISVSTEGYYNVNAVSEYGCTSSSNFLSVNSLPNVSIMPTGCYQVCFPFNVCAPAQNGIRNYQWLKDGELIGSASSKPDFIAAESGDYQVIIETFQGCKDTSDVMTLYPEPIDHEVEGIVYIDNNQNDIFDAGDELVEGATVIFSIGNVVQETTLTDLNGYYTFDNINHHRINIEVDISGLGLDIPPSEYIEYQEFNLCNDDQELNFPLISDCMDTRETVELFSCNGDPVDYNGNLYNVGDFEEFSFTSVAGCDSIVEVIVSPLPQPNYTLVPSMTCINDDSGMLEIIGADPGFSFSIDGAAFSPLFLYENLSAGNHTLEVVDNNGCIYTETFVIDEVLPLNPVFNVSSACVGIDNGQLEIILPSGADYEVSVDGSGFVLNQFDWTGLAEGNYTINIIDSNGCPSDFSFTVDEVVPFVISLSVSPSCEGLDNGTLDINLPLSSDYNISIDGGTPVLNQLSWTDLSVGNHTVTVLDLSGCEVSETFTITETPRPDFLVLTNVVCDGNSNGTAEVIVTTPGVFQFGLDNTTMQSNARFDNLGAGMFTLWVSDEFGCMYTTDFVIETMPEPEVLWTLNETCKDESNGSIQVGITTPGNYMLAVDDNSNLANQFDFDNLAAGQHTLYVMDDNGCEYEFSFEIQEFPEPVVNFETNSSCAGDSNGSIEIQSTDIVAYSLDATNFISELVITDLMPDLYMILLEDVNGCIKEYEVQITEAPKLEVVVEEYNLDCSIKSVNIAPQVMESAGEVSFNWSTGEVTESITADASDVYQVEVSDQCSTVIFEWDLQFDGSVANEEIYMPNIFDPSGAFPDSEFRPLLNPDIEVLDYSFDIFDRWGNRVNTSIDPQQGWNGDHLNKEARSGVYVWMYEIRAVHCGEEYVLKNAGDVTLVR